MKIFMRTKTYFPLIIIVVNKKKFRKLEKEIPIYTVLPYCVIATYEDAQLIDFVSHNLLLPYL